MPKEDSSPSFNLSATWLRWLWTRLASRPVADDVCKRGEAAVETSVAVAYWRMALNVVKRYVVIGRAPYGDRIRVGPGAVVSTSSVIDFPVFVAHVSYWLGRAIVVRRLARNIQPTSPGVTNHKVTDRDVLATEYCYSSRRRFQRRNAICCTATHRVLFGVSLERKTIVAGPVSTPVAHLRV